MLVALTRALKLACNPAIFGSYSPHEQFIFTINIAVWRRLGRDQCDVHGLLKVGNKRISRDSRIEDNHHITIVVNPTRFGL